MGWAANRGAQRPAGSWSCGARTPLRGSPGQAPPPARPCLTPLTTETDGGVQARSGPPPPRSRVGTGWLGQGAGPGTGRKSPPPTTPPCVCVSPLLFFPNVNVGSATFTWPAEEGVEPLGRGGEPGRVRTADRSRGTATCYKMYKHYTYLIYTTMRSCVCAWFGLVGICFFFPRMPQTPVFT